MCVVSDSNFLGAGIEVGRVLRSVRLSTLLQLQQSGEYFQIRRIKQENFVVSREGRYLHL